MPSRYYQDDACDGIDRVFDSGAQSTLLVMPTGTGKTHVFSQHLRRLVDRGTPGRHMVMAHREELISQAKGKLENICGYRVGIEKATFATSTDDAHDPPRGVVTTPQTQVAGKPTRRMERFDPNEFSRLIVDEAHHYARHTGWSTAIDHYRQNSDCKVLGVTATPNRLDEAALGQMFDEVAFAWDFTDARDEGWLCPVKARACRVEAIDLRTVPRRGRRGDFVEKHLSNVMRSKKVLFGISAVLRDHLEPRKTLVFCSSVDAAQDLCEMRQAAGVNAAWVCGDKRRTSDHDRKRIIRGFASGEITEVYNVGVFTEGFDDPTIERIVMARPTLSEALYRQMMGRGTRTWPGLLDVPDLAGRDKANERKLAISSSRKSHIEIIDLVGVTAMNARPITATTALGGQWDDPVVEEAQRIVERDEAIDTEAALELAAEHLERERCIDEVWRQMEAERKQAMYREVEYTAKVTIGTMESPTEEAERLLGAKYVRERGFFRGRRPSEPQLNVLERAGIPFDDTTTMAWASKMISRIQNRTSKGLSSFRQMRVLEKHGIDGTKMSFDDAKKLVGDLQRQFG